MMEERLCYLLAYLAEALIFWLYAEGIFGSRLKTAKVLTITFGTYLLLFACSLLNITALNTLSFLVGNALLLLFCYGASWQGSLLHGALLSFIMTITEILTALLLSLFVHDFAAYTYDVTVMITMAILCKLFYLLVALAISRLFRTRERRSVEPARMVVFVLLPLVSTVFSVIIAYLGLQEGFNRTTGMVVATSVMVLLGCNLLFLALYRWLQNAEAQRLSAELGRQKDAADAAFYKLLAEEREVQRTLVHDTRNHLQVLSGMLSEGRTQAAMEYLQDLTQRIRTTTPHLCADPVMNLILAEGAKQAKAHTIRFDFDVPAGSIAFLDDADKTALFGNLLSNALEAAAKTTARWVELRTMFKSDPGIVVISISNSCETAPHTDEHGHYLTTKKDKRLHGLGLKSILRVIQKYEGNHMIKYLEEEEEFRFVIQFPLRHLREEGKIP